MPPAALPIPGTTKHTSDQHAPLYNVVLLNDDDHTAEYVIEMLEKLFAITRGPKAGSMSSKSTTRAVRW